MPDLNYRNEAITTAMHDAARFWLEEMARTASGSTRSSI